MKRLLLVFVSFLVFTSCFAQQKNHESKYRIVIKVTKKNGYRTTYSYAIERSTNKRKKIRFSENSHIYAYIFNDGSGDLKLFSAPSGKNVFVVGYTRPCGNGWTCQFLIYKINTETLKKTFITDCAAFKVLKDGFQIASARLKNPKAKFSYEQEYLLHDVFYDFNGNIVRRSKEEYSFSKMESKYKKCLSKYY